MQRRYDLRHLVLASVVVLGLMLLMVCVEAQARIAFESDSDRHVINNSFAYEIYAMDADGGNPQNLTNNLHDDWSPSWFNFPFSVSPAGKTFTMWGRLKRINR